MIVVRNVFRLKFGQARQAVALWREGREVMRRAGSKGSPRLLTDLVGQSYTLVFENTTTAWPTSNRGHAPSWGLTSGRRGTRSSYPSPSPGTARFSRSSSSDSL